MASVALEFGIRQAGATCICSPHVCSGASQFMLLADDFDARCGLDVVEMILTECIYIVLAFTGSLVA